MTNKLAIYYPYNLKNLSILVLNTNSIIETLIVIIWQTHSCLLPILKKDVEL